VEFKIKITFRLYDSEFIFYYKLEEEKGIFMPIEVQKGNMGMQKETSNGLSLATGFRLKF